MRPIEIAATSADAGASKSEKTETELIEHLFFYATKEYVVKTRQVEYEEVVTDDEAEAAAGVSDWNDLIFFRPGPENA